MPRHISILFPGQGSQCLGMLNSHSNDALHYLEKDINNMLGYNLVDVINNGPIDLLNKTSVTQPAILLTSFLEFKNILQKLDIKPNILCGHSLGEYTALVAANSISLEDAILLVQKRGILMEKCKKGSMCAILNVDKDIISKTCKQIENKFNTIVAPANINSPKQIVISGTTIGVNQVVKHLTQIGYKKCIKLNVSVASHSRLMDEISKDFRDELNEIDFNEPNCEVIHNVDNKSSSDIFDLKEKLLNQLTCPVQWTNTMNYIKKFNGIVIECGPNKILTGIAKSNGIKNIFSTSSKNFIDEIKEVL